MNGTAAVPAKEAASLPHRLGERLGASPSTSDRLQLTRSEGERLLRIIAQASRIKRHYELFLLLQGDAQHLIPHQILICAWGDFRGPNLRLDVISAIPGVRTGRLNGCDIEKSLKSLYFRWLAHERRAMLLDSAAAGALADSRCDCALHRSLRSMRSVLVHGMHDARDGTDSMYFAAHADSIVNEGDLDRFGLLADPVIAQIDLAFRRVTGLKSEGMPPAAGSGMLSTREEEILAWVAEGRTNVEIARILAISAFTVKNHVQRIIKKLGAANRTEAVAKYRQLAPRGRRQSSPEARAAAAIGTAARLRAQICWER